MISPAYREMQTKLHEDIRYGCSSVHYAPVVSQIINRFDITEMLDYGAGKGRLGDSLNVDHSVRVSRYDPAIPGWDTLPEPNQFVCCVDVLEHIEPEYLDDVILDLKRVTKKYGFFTIHTSAAVKILPDGRNAHLTQEDIGWWFPKIAKHFRVKELHQGMKHGYWMFVKSEDSQEDS